MKVNPLLPYVGHTLLPPRLRVQGPLDETVARHAPVPLAAPRGPLDLVTRAPQGQQRASARARSLPLFPVAQPHAPPEPLGPFDPLRIALAVADVMEPFRDLPLESFDAGGHLVPVAPVVISRTCSLTRLTAASVPCSFTRLRSQPRKVHTHTCAVVRVCGLTRRRQVPLDEAADAVQHPLCRPLRGHEDQKVIGVARKSPSAPLQLLVQIVEHHLGQPRRQRTPLRHPTGGHCQINLPLVRLAPCMAYSPHEPTTAQPTCISAIASRPRSSATVSGCTSASA